MKIPIIIDLKLTHDPPDSKDYEYMKFDGSSPLDDNTRRELDGQVKYDNNYYECTDPLHLAEDYVEDCIVSD